MRATLVLMAASAASMAAFAAVTAGWENICPERREFPAKKVVWTAPGAGFDVCREDGAEAGDVQRGKAMASQRTQEQADDAPAGSGEQHQRCPTPFGGDGVAMGSAHFLCIQ